MVELEVRFPERSRASSSFSANKPMAEVTCVLDSGRSREIVVPVRVARILRDCPPAFPLEEQEAFDAIHAIEERCCFALLTEMLARRDYATEEAATKLARYGYRTQEINTVIARAQEARFLNDDRFARTFIEERKRRGWGRRKIELELSRRGIRLDDIPDYPDAFFDPDEDAQRAFDALARCAIPRERAFDKLMRKLMQKGFSYSVARDAVTRRLSDNSEVSF